MVVLDMTVVNIALPKIQTDLGFSAAGLSWVVSGYLLAFGGLLLLGGRAGDILGRRRMFVTGITLFTAASVLGGLAPDAATLLAARAVQGIGAAVCAPSVVALIMANFAEGRERVRALSYFSAVSGAGGSIGLVLGGMLTSWASWRWVFFINVPIGLALVLLAPRYIRETPRFPGRFDLAGALTATTAMTSLVYGFIRVSSNGWGNAGTALSFAAAVILLIALVVIEKRAAQPILPMHLLAERNRAGAYLTMLFAIAGLFSTFFFLTQFVQTVLGFSPVEAGVAFLPMTLTLMGTARLLPRILPRLGAKRVLVPGVTLSMIALLWLSRVTADTGYLSGVVGPMLLIGLGMGCTILPLNVTILARVRPEESGAAAGVLQTMQMVGGSLGLAILVTVYGTASRNAAGHEPAHAAMAHGMSSAFTVAAIFAACALVLATTAIRVRPRIQSGE
jgi:EmrB/QacA subfamily drug resistance transporter